MTRENAPPAKRADKLGFRPKRFWNSAGVTAVDTAFSVVLDSRPVKTPGGAKLTLPSLRAAEAVAAEWQVVGSHVDYDAMPLTRLGFAAIDRMKDLTEDSVTEVLRYAQTDVVCYPSQYPQALIEREQAAWLPLLAWAREHLGLTFTQNLTLVHQPQPEQTLVTLEAMVRRLTAFESAGLMMAVPLFGSVVLALAVRDGHLSGETAFAASRIGDDFQSEVWGRDAEAAQRDDAMRHQATCLQTWFEALRVAGGLPDSTSACGP